MITTNKKIKQSDEKITELEEKLLNIFDSVKDGICVMDKTGKVTHINRTITEIGGWTKEDLIGQRLGLLKTFFPGDIPKIVSIFTQRMKGKDMPPYKIDVRMKDGGRKPVEINAAAVKVGGKIVGDVAILRDLTERKKEQEELKKSLEELEKKNEELEKFNKLAIGREMRIIELKNKIKELEK